MGQVDHLRAFDSTALDAMLLAGLADDAIYTPAIGDPIATRVLVDRAVQTIGDYGQVSGPHNSVTFLVAEVSPKKGETVTVGTETFTLESKQSEDEARAVWTVSND